MSHAGAAATPQPPHESLGPAHVAGALALGVLAGIFSGLLGVGGGLIMVPGMVLVLRTRQHVANATSLAAIVPTAVAGVVAFGRASAVDWRIGALLAAGSIPGARIGAKVMQRIPADRLRVVFGVFVILVAIVMAVTR